MLIERVMEAPQPVDNGVGEEKEKGLFCEAPVVDEDGWKLDIKLLLERATIGMNPVCGILLNRRTCKGRCCDTKQKRCGARVWIPIIKVARKLAREGKLRANSTEKCVYVTLHSELQLLARAMQDAMEDNGIIGASAHQVLLKDGPGFGCTAVRSLVALTTQVLHLKLEGLNHILSQVENVFANGEAHKWLPGLSQIDADDIGKEMQRSIPGRVVTLESGNLELKNGHLELKKRVVVLEELVRAPQAVPVFDSATLYAQTPPSSFEGLIFIVNAIVVGGNIDSTWFSTKVTCESSDGNGMVTLHTLRNRFSQFVSLHEQLQQTPKGLLHLPDLPDQMAMAYLRYMWTNESIKRRHAEV